MWGEAKAVGCLLSLGTGRFSSSTQPFLNPLDRSRANLVAPVLFDLHPEVVHDWAWNQDNYYRLNPKLDDRLGLEEWNKVDEVKSAVKKYLQESNLMVIELIEAMKAV